ncbi:BatA domain-containing protein [Microbulbifer spongiae]|uniref:BatA domain-containing protein n=1 Tax=Microbulbifer spongiae TaxID=2944933 RepID=A0ABY9E905_9GAMM|nr:BatA domain-containing protein [Microbulbifer sp. MI-G]WKD49478.1 BatA domain-containing protein [Microbulbifer sp. MI-G]
MLWINLFFQSPQWLWLFAALAIPIAIHLLRRSNPQQISFAAVQWIQRYAQSRARRPVVDNKWLLLLRLLLVALLVLLLAQPLIKRALYPQEAVILVDPGLAAADANAFIHSSLPQLAEVKHKVLWLSPETAEITSPPPQYTDLWKTLSRLSHRADLRRAHILLANDTFPASHRALQISPHWQWHSLHRPSTVQSPILPRIAVMGKAPSWWTPVLEDWRDTMPQLSVKTLEPEAAPKAQQTDWLIYTGSTPLPQTVMDFVSSGGLLITDKHTQGPDNFNFATVDRNPLVQAAPVGRGSWLRYGSDWHSAEFYRRANLPDDLWQQWSAQDWPLQHRNRSQWSGNTAIGIPVTDSAVERHRSEPLQSWLIAALLILLALERLLALTQPPAHAADRNSGETHHG